MSPVGKLSSVLPSFQRDGREEEAGKGRGKGRKEGNVGRGGEGGD